MIDTELIKKNLNNTLEGTNFQNLGNKLQGKVRDVYERDDKIILISTDRQSAFDRNLAFVPFKGQVLTETSLYWFKETQDIVKSHVISSPDPNVVLGYKYTIFPVEFVMRGYLTGVTSTAVWTAYEKGERDYCGNILPDGMRKNQQFDQPLITPTTKSTEHDEKISTDEIVAKGLMTRDEWEHASGIAFKLFERGQALAAKKGLILVDTKYEFGHDGKGNVFLCDEIHTPDSSRYWLSDTYLDNYKAGKEPDNIDKEFIRIWFKDNCDPYKDEVLPTPPDDLIVSLSGRYIQLYEMITGKEFIYHDTSVIERIAANIKNLSF